MSAQFDVLAGFDPSGQNQISGSQLLQMVNQIAPLSNIGGVIAMSGAANAHPDVTNNPRFIRYIWLDTQTANVVLIKIYQGTAPSDTYADWSTVAIADGSITATKLANYAVSILNASLASKIAYKQDGTADATKSNYLLRLDAAGQYVEVVDAATVFSPLTVALGQIFRAGAANGSVLQIDSSTGLPAWATLSISTLITDNSLSLSKLLYFDAGSSNFILAVNSIAPYDIKAVNNNCVTNNTLLPIRSIPIDRLDATGAALRDNIRFDGTNWVKKTPYFNAAAAATIPASNTGGIVSVAHGLGALPRRIGGYAVNINAEFGYVTGDIIDLANVMQTGNGGEVRLGVTVGADVTNVWAVFVLGGAAGGAQGYRVARKDTYVPSATIMTTANWSVTLWAEL